MKWWKDYFDIKYTEVFAKSFGRKTTNLELKMLRELLPQPPARVLDAGCSLGRLSIGLAVMGYHVTGTDQSADLLAQARAAAQEKGVQVHFVEGEHTSFDWQNEFDVVINIFTSFGYYEDDKENLRVISSWARALRPGGHLIIELDHRDQVVRSYKANYWYVLEDKTEIRVNRWLDAIRGLNMVDEYWRTPDGQEGERHHFSRLYNATELASMLTQAHLVPIAWYGDFDLRPFTFESKRLVVVAEKQAETP